MAGHPHLFGVDDLSSVVNCGAGQHPISIEPKAEITLDSITEQIRGFDHELVMADEPGRCSEIGEQRERTSDGYQARQ